MFVKRLFQLVWLVLTAALPVAAYNGVPELQATAVWKTPGADFGQVLQANWLLAACVVATVIWLVSVVVVAANRHVTVGTLRLVCIVPGLVALGLIVAARQYGLNPMEWGYLIALTSSVLAMFIATFIAVGNGRRAEAPAPAKVEVVTAAPAKPAPKAPVQEPRKPAEQKADDKVKQAVVVAAAQAAPEQEQRPARLN